MPNAMQCFHTGRIYIVFCFFSSSSVVVLEIQDAQCYAVLSHRKNLYLCFFFVSSSSAVVLEIRMPNAMQCFHRKKIDKNNWMCRRVVFFFVLSKFVIIITNKK